MVPRTKIVALPETASFDDVRLVLREHKFSRLPVYRGSLDNVVGILHAKDLFDLSDEEEKNFELSKYVDPPFLVPEFKRAEDLFREMRRRHTHMAIVVDEHGGTAGLATIEDAIEELLGQIQDEFDEEKPGFEPAGRTHVRPRGQLPPRRHRGAVRHQAPPRRGRDDRRPPHAPIRADPAQGRAVEGPVRRLRHRGRHAHRHPADQDDPAVDPRKAGGRTERAATRSRSSAATASAPRSPTPSCRSSRPPSAPLDLRGGPSSAAAPRRPRAIPCPHGPSTSIRKNRVALKGPVGTPIGKGFQSVNVRLRQALDLYANLRPVKNVPAVPSRFSGRGPRRRAGEHRGPLQRPRAHRRSRRRRVAQDHHRGRLDAHRPIRLRVRPRATGAGASPRSTRRTS